MAALAAAAYPTWDVCIPRGVETEPGAIRDLVLEMPPAVAAQALGHTAECTEEHAAQAGARWASYPVSRKT